MTDSAPVKLTQTTLFDAGKELSQFRVYEKSNARYETVKETYRLMHENQTVQFVQDQHKKWLKFDHAKLTILEALELLNSFVDDSDPDIDLPNSVHAFQTAERLREKHPNEDWLHLTGLLHDVGKVMGVWGQPQWCNVGDTFPVGCAFDSVVVHSDSFAANPDTKDPRYNTQCGIYEEGCGFSKINMSWGHDEYMYRVLVHNKSTLPKEALYLVRYHSFYPWHNGGAYKHLMDDSDRELFKWIKEFNKFDLYSKSDSVPDVKAVTPYYQSLIDKYCPGLLEF